MKVRTGKWEVRKKKQQTSHKTTGFHFLQLNSFYS